MTTVTSDAADKRWRGRGGIGTRATAGGNAKRCSVCGKRSAVLQQVAREGAARSASGRVIEGRRAGLGRRSQPLTRAGRPRAWTSSGACRRPGKEDGSDPRYGVGGRGRCDAGEVSRSKGRESSTPLARGSPGTQASFACARRACVFVNMQAGPSAGREHDVRKAQMMFGVFIAVQYF